ncbi:hypothetical protein DPEC_G00017100 [Dallia pectoralis]|uniref:Uncharacterized protein n=1 Tax=Dallia pectoralis TaxID=75939 RepID=A0ACC2HEY7_DALPE|nr:hypothetical protein DPEC_G00017100 [Dallia pectoralis]
MATGPRPCPAAVKAHVKKQQSSMKQRFDEKHKAKWAAIRVSDWVRARRPHRANKLSSFWSAPYQVSRQLGHSFQLTDGSRWHTSCLRRVPSPFHHPHLAGVEQSNPATEPAPHVRIPWRHLLPKLFRPLRTLLLLQPRCRGPLFLSPGLSRNYIFNLLYSMKVLNLSFNIVNVLYLGDWAHFNFT